MMKSEPVPFAVGDVVRLKKPHPCGGLDWTVVRLGADIGLTCQRCGRRVLLPRRNLERRLKQFLARGPGVETTVDRDMSPGEQSSRGEAQG
jgi:hypothetical protein